MRESLVLLLACLMCVGCQRETRVERGNLEQVLHLGNGNEVEGLDPQLTTGITEHNIISSLFEGLLGEDPNKLTPVPGVAERWEVSDDQLTYTFHLRENAKWSDGSPVTAGDFAGSWKRILTPALAAEYANMLFPLKNAEAYYRGELRDFNEVGIRVVDDRTLVVTLRAVTPYFLGMMANHYTWWAVPVHVIEQFGGMDKRGTKWTDPGNMVCNGPFVLTRRDLNSVTVVERNTNYWDAGNVKLNAIYFYPIELRDAEERAFRSGQLHATYELIPDKIPVYQREHPELLRIDPYLGTYFFRLNVTAPALTDKRVRRALAMAIDRKSIAENIAKGGQQPAEHYVPPDTAGYTARARLSSDVGAARKLLAEAGYPDGKGLPALELHFNTDERHKAIAEALQQMWKRELNIDVTLRNEEWKVYLDTQDRQDYQISRAGWIGDYIDPFTFLEIFKTGNGNNDTGWSNQEYDRLLEEASVATDEEGRYELFQRAEAILLDEVPIIPVMFYTKPYNLHPSVKNWSKNVLSHRPYKHIYLEP